MNRAGDKERRYRDAAVLRRSASRYMLNNDRTGLYELMLNMADQPGMVRIRIMNPQGVISYSTAPAEVGATVDKGAEACYGCHAQSQPLARIDGLDVGDLQEGGLFVTIGWFHAD